MFSPLDCLEATPLTVTRRTATVDGIVTERVAARDWRSPLRLAPGSLLHSSVAADRGSRRSCMRWPASSCPPRGRSGGDDDEDPARPRQWSWRVASRGSRNGRARRSSPVGSSTRCSSPRQLGDDTPGLEGAPGDCSRPGLGAVGGCRPRHLSGARCDGWRSFRRSSTAPTSCSRTSPPSGRTDTPGPPSSDCSLPIARAGGAIVTATHDQAVIDRAHQAHHLDGQPREAPGTHGRPWLSGRNLLALLAGAALAVPAGVASPGWRASIVLLALQFVLAVAGLTSRRAGLFRPLRALAIRLPPGVLAALSVACRPGSSVAAASTSPPPASRVLLIVLPSAVLLPSSTPTDWRRTRAAAAVARPVRRGGRGTLHRMQSFGDIWTEMPSAQGAMASGSVGAERNRSCGMSSR